MFLLKSKPYTDYGHYDGYYTGKKYRVCRETYAIIVNYDFYVVSEGEEKLGWILRRV